MDEELLMLGFKNYREAMVMLVRHVWFVALGAMIAAAAGCSSILGDKLNPAYCAAHPTDPDCRNAFPDAGGCTSSAQCSSPTAVCATDKMACVQCTTTEHDACTGNLPVCGVDDTCRKCSAHTECSSNACLPDGSCGDDTSVAYVDPAGVGTTCTKASPCKKVSDALKTSRPFIKFQGTTNEKVVLNGLNVTFLADPGAKLTDTMNGILLQIEGSSQVAIYDLEIGGASGANTPGISVQPGSTATMTLTRAKLAGNTGPGISVSSGMVTISQSMISGNTGPGISTSSGMVSISQSTISGNTGPGTSASGGTLIVSRSTVASNNGGGILTSATAFTIRNNFIYRNGNTSMANSGGMGAVGIVDPSVLEFNTIVDNLASGDTLSVGGVLCDRTGFVAPNNLIFRNTGGTAGNVQTLGICSFGNSLISAGTGPVDNTPMFAHPNSTPFDYHLTPASPGTIVDAAGPCTGVDFDGDARPVGAACDLGADERKP
jgi:hypothetical protein